MSVVVPATHPNKMRWNFKLYNILHRIICTLCGHPLWKLEIHHKQYSEMRYCGCGRKFTFKEY